MKQPPEKVPPINARIAQVREALALNQEAFAGLLSISRSFLSNIEKGRNGVPFDVLTFLIEAKHVSAHWLHTGQGPMFSTSAAADGHLNGHPNGHPIGRNEINHVSNEVKEPAAPRLEVTHAPFSDIVVATQDTQGNPTYTVVNHKAAANYKNGYQSQEFIESLGAVTLPRIIVGSQRQGIFFQIKGDSMLPRFQHGDWVACTLLDRPEWRYLRDSECYVVVSEGYGIQFKRVKNRLQSSARSITCLSDNREHRPYNIPAEDILQLFRFVLHVSSDSSNPEESINQKVDHLEDTTTDLRQMYERMQEQLNQLTAAQNTGKDQQKTR